ncbi:HNH endonuclease [Acinetobacter phage Acj9]|uniref:Mob-like putative homing endonuclease n=1 Tax=Acinetobacter phage Acj9 TaxID=760939 RepID=E5EPV7_9CAUD|nr:HNH endonuclease [Acinetobacter phage Acj9]ADG60073.1 Mob-like putative homing endonuclease [Acinetobacter phage Acj9]
MKLVVPYTGDEYSERHHVLPKSLFPEFEREPSNIVRIEFYQHLNAHKLLASTEDPKMILAYHFMFSSVGQRFGNLSDASMKSFENEAIAARRAMAKVQSARGKLRVGALNSFYGKTHSAEFKAKIGDRHRGKKLSPEHLEKLVASHKGKPKRLVECPHCKVMIANHAKNRRHFDNCAHKENQNFRSLVQLISSSLHCFDG